MNGVLTLLLSHQPPAELDRVLRVWQQVADPGGLLLAYGGREDYYEMIDFEPKIMIRDARLRTSDQQRERQSCAGVVREAARWLQSRPEFQYVHFVEYDHLPLVADLYDRMIARMESERADALAYHLRRIDGTSDVHYLHHADDSRFHDYFSSLTVRSDPEVIMAMLGTGSFWRLPAFAAVASREEPFPIYFEIYLPTLAHHLGYRLRDLGEQNAFVWNLGDFSNQIRECKASGAWTAHPIKDIISPESIFAQ
ncbi:hypothetical protein BH20VER3_BH20VER3_02670 [soil metagenome]